MSLDGQARNPQAGYAMAVLLVGIAVMTIMLSVAMPVWHQQVQREKEAELIFRGEQYAHAIVLFQHKYGAALPPNVDVLVEQKFLRKKYKDPITGGDFQPIYQATASQPGTVPGQTTGGAAGQPRAGSAPSAGSGRPSGDITGTTPQGGLIGVVSKSTAAAIRLYNGFDHYNQWAFLYTQVAPVGGPGAVGGQGGGTARPGQPTSGRPQAPKPPQR
jgi:type II secretory pathway pseudopilin PulG